MSNSRQRLKKDGTPDRRFELGGGSRRPKSTRKPGKQKGEPGHRVKAFDDDAIVAALRKKKGMVFLAAKLLGCSAATIYKRAKESELIRETMAEARGKVIDDAEEKLANAVARGEAWAITLALKTIGKHRGYVERMEQTGADGAPLEKGTNVVIVEVPAERNGKHVLEPTLIEGGGDARVE